MTASYIGIAKHGSHKKMRLVIFGCNVMCRMWIIFMALCNAQTRPYQVESSQPTRPSNTSKPRHDMQSKEEADR